MWFRYANIEGPENAASDLDLLCLPVSLFGVSKPIMG